MRTCDLQRSVTLSMRSHWAGRRRGDFLSSRSPKTPRIIQAEFRKVELLGSKSELKWARGARGLEIQVPNGPPVSMRFPSESWRTEFLGTAVRCWTNGSVSKCDS